MSELGEIGLSLDSELRAVLSAETCLHSPLPDTLDTVGPTPFSCPSLSPHILLHIARLFLPKQHQQLYTHTTSNSRVYDLENFFIARSIGFFGAVLLCTAVNCRDRGCPDARVQKLTRTLRPGDKNNPPPKPTSQPPPILRSRSFELRHH